MHAHKHTLHEFLGKAVHVVIDRPIGTCHKGIVYPVNYGYLPDVIGGDSEEQDVYILGVTQPLTVFDGIVIGIVRRHNDCEDKLIAAPEGMVLHQGQIAAAVHFQEQYFDYSIESLFRKSCGVLPYQIVDGTREFLLLFQSHSQSWSLPKGHMEAGETEEITALRELKEETGLTAVLEPDRRAVTEYPLSPVSRKQVVLFLGQVSGTVQPQAGEIAAFQWVREENLKDFLLPDTVNACKKLLKSI